VNRRFRLAAVEKLRGGKLADAARALGTARREVVAALTYRDQLRRELRTTQASSRSAPYELESAAARRARLREDLARAGERVGLAQGRELAAMAAWNAARSPTPTRGPSRRRPTSWPPSPGARTRRVT